MRRLVLILLMLLVPTQASWSASHAIRGYVESMAVSDHFHAHGHDHRHDGEVSQETPSSCSVAGMLPDGDMTKHGDEGQHGCHFHPAFTLMLPTHPTGLPIAGAALPPSTPSTSFTSHIPPLSDRPPAARI